jgi:hypothetical protein
MTAVEYDRTCPLCLAALVPLEDRPEVAPWKCEKCLFCFWVAELTEEGRKLFDPAHTPPHNFLSSPYYKSTRPLIDTEIAEARERGTSLRPDQKP